MCLRFVVQAMVVAALSYGLAGCAARTANPQAIDDALTAARIRTALVNDPQLGPRAIEVRVTAGVAHLSGGEFTEAEEAHLQQIVRAVAGVTGVEATVEIAASPRDPSLDPAVLVLVKRPPSKRR